MGTLRTFAYDTKKLTRIDRMVALVSPQRALRRVVAREALHQFSYDAAIGTHKRNQAPQNIAPNDTRTQQDRIQLMREAIDLERNFAPAVKLNRAYAMYVAPTSYHARTGDQGLDRAVDEWLQTYWFKNCDITNRFDFFTMLAFGVMGMNRAGDHGWAFMRPGLEAGMNDAEKIALPLKIQNVEGDRIGGLWQNIVTPDYVAGCTIGTYGEIVSFRVFRRALTVQAYDNPIDVPAANFVHYTDPMQMDVYRGVTKYCSVITDMRDLYEMKDFLKGKAKLASALTVMTNSLGAIQGPGGMDGYQTNLTPGGVPELQQDINFGQINHLPGAQNIEFPDTASPGTESQYLMEMLLKMCAMGFNLPYSFALDASALGGVSSRLESEQARAEFSRGKDILEPKADRLKNSALIDACAKNTFPAKYASIIGRGHWGYRQHPQPDIGREASADVSRYQNGLLNPIKYWPKYGEDPETVARDMVKWAVIKKNALDEAKALLPDITVEDVFGNGPAMPSHISTSVTAEDVVNTQDSPDAAPAKDRIPDDKSKADDAKKTEAKRNA